MVGADEHVIVLFLPKTENGTDLIVGCARVCLSRTRRDGCNWKLEIARTSSTEPSLEGGSAGRKINGHQAVQQFVAAELTTSANSALLRAVS